ncbi:MAG: nitronate monooxygenase [Rhodocyclaceae bacterium]|jgi:nitronate monooxygenase|nr:nitronate monooxygenase [Rhodocyclaceae bacterium]
MPTRALNDLRLPIIVSPMFLASGVDLVSACCRSGVVGTLPAHNARNSEEFGSWLRQIEDSLVDVQAPGPLAVNLNVNKARMQRLEADLTLVAEHCVPLVVTSVGDPREVVEAVHGYGGKVFHDVTNLRHAEKAIEAGVDGLILVCAGAGGHSGALSPFALVPQVRRLFDGYVVLAGAISDGRSIRAAQMLGADLVYMGTRFLASQEAAIAPDYKALLMQSQTADVLYTPRISGVNANFLATSIRQRGLDPDNLPEVHRLYRQPEGQDLPKPWVELWSAGQGVGLIDDLPSVEALVSRLEAEYRNAEGHLARSCSQTH